MNQLLWRGRSTHTNATAAAASSARCVLQHNFHTPFMVSNNPQHSVRVTRTALNACMLVKHFKSNLSGDEQRERLTFFSHFSISFNNLNVLFYNLLLLLVLIILTLIEVLHVSFL